MGSTCVSVLAFLWALKINWEAWSAIGTVAAAFLAMWLPGRAAQKEWKRQDEIREKDLARAKKEKNDVIREVTSSVARILSYRNAAIAICDADNVYGVGFLAIERINQNSRTYLEMLEILENRPELTDGAIYSAIFAKRIAQVVIEQTSVSNNGWNWNERSNVLRAYDTVAEMTEARNRKARIDAGCKPDSSVADLIGAKYKAVAEAIAASRKADSGEPIITVTDEYY
ncbi:hypothetical protein [Novosphingobium sp. JCM 18896]|uniref:hypothetical protein n=1 Tax=Novosphingobium sp. JCM 18896 TaxID=2989731 RepID=UPI002222EAA4|nr:hypothetical protein [Novosphingobium sp. JCM 18896]MCW1432017.1 hypothetical protein [Novosphingobium sp. JCM 18896]